MNLIEVMERFPDQETCIKHLEKLDGKIILNVLTAKAKT